MSAMKTSAWLLSVALLAAACGGGGAAVEGDMPEAAAGAAENALAVYEAQLEENKRIASQFFTPGVTAEDRIALLHPDYIQHNPAFKKFADENGISYYEGFQQMMGNFGGGGRGGGGGQANDAPQPPPGNSLYLVMAEDDLVFIMHQQFVQDPDEDPGTFYEAFAWDTFRIRDGMLYEHWDGARINPAQ